MFNGSHWIKDSTCVFSLISQENSLQYAHFADEQLKAYTGKCFGQDHERWQECRARLPGSIRWVAKHRPRLDRPCCTLTDRPPATSSDQSFTPPRSQQFSAIGLIPYLTPENIQVPRCKFAQLPALTQRCLCLQDSRHTQRGCPSSSFLSPQAPACSEPQGTDHPLSTGAFPSALNK